MSTFTTTPKSGTSYEAVDEFMGADSSIGWPVGTIYAIGQTFSISEAADISQTSFLLAKSTGGTGYLTAAIYALTGTPGTNGKPTGSPLGVSSQVSEADLPVTSTLSQFQEKAFQFDTPVELSPGDYCVALILENQSVTIRVAHDASSLADAGNGFLGTDSETWDGGYSADVVFKVSVATVGGATASSIAKTIDWVLREQGDNILSESGGYLELENGGVTFSTLTKNAENFSSVSKAIDAILREQGNYILLEQGDFLLTEF